MRFLWDYDNLRHIAEHDVSSDEVEYVLLHPTTDLGMQNWHEIEERFAEVGATAAGRFLLAVSSIRDDAVRVVTAFDAPRWAIQAYLDSR